MARVWCTMVQNRKKTAKTPSNNSLCNKWGSMWEWSELCGASKWVSGASIRTNRWAIGPVLTSGFLVNLYPSDVAIDWWEKQAWQKKWQQTYRQTVTEMTVATMWQKTRQQTDRATTWTRVACLLLERPKNGWYSSTALVVNCNLNNYAKDWLYEENLISFNTHQDEHWPIFLIGSLFLLISYS